MRAFDMKDPAFLFYASDFLTGCTNLTMEERGQYITLLCIQHQTGHLSEKTIRLALGSVSVDVISKFVKDENDLYYNIRLDIEIEKRTNFIDTRRSNGSLGGRPKKEEKPLGYPLGKPTAKPNGKAKKNLIEDRDVIENKYVFNIEFINKDFENCFKIWLDYKLEIKDYFSTQIGIEKAYSHLLKLSGNNIILATKIIDQSIMNNWKGLFEYKGKIEESEKGSNIFDINLITPELNFSKLYSMFNLPNDIEYYFDRKVILDMCKQGKYQRL